MTATRPEVDELVGRYIRLDLLTEADLPALHEAIGHPEVFESGFGGGPGGYRADFDGFAAWARGNYLFGRDDALVWGIRLAGGVDDGMLVGSSTLAELDLPNEGAHLGWTAYDPRVWGTAVNPEAKLLLLGLAFEHGFGRVTLQADSINGRSRRAIEKLGAEFEGIRRHDRRRADGSWRDSAVYSILAEEWPVVRARLEDRLAAWGDRPVEAGAAR